MLCRQLFWVRHSVLEIAEKATFGCLFHKGNIAATLCTHMGLNLRCVVMSNKALLNSYAIHSVHTVS